MYLPNKYTKWYNNIITNAQNRAIFGYTEKHHIIPKSLGGTNDPINLVALTAREHFICHLLLTKMLLGKERDKMVYAAMFLRRGNNGQIKINSRTYETLKYEFGLSHSRRVITDEFRQKMSDIRKGKTLSEEHKKKIGDVHRGKIESTETRLKKSVAQTGRIHTDDTKKKLSELKKGKPGHPRSAKTREKMSIAHRNRLLTNIPSSLDIVIE